MHLTHRPQVVEAMHGLGYPDYLSTILGTAKVLGAFVLASGNWPMRELAFFCSAPAASHAFILVEGNRLRRQGIDVVIGYVEPHDRPETAAQIWIQKNHSPGFSPGLSAVISYLLVGVPEDEVVFC